MVLHSDWGGKNLSQAFDQHLTNAGTMRRLTVHDSTQPNGVTVCLNCTLVEKVHVLLHVAALLHNMWGEAL